MARSLQHLMIRACSSIQSKASCLLAYEADGFSHSHPSKRRLRRKPECASAHFRFPFTSRGVDVRKE